MGVEFLGLPGSGKSSLSRRIAAMLAQNGVPVRQTAHALAHGPRGAMRRMAKIWIAGGEILGHPGYALRSARALRLSGQRSTRIALKMLLNWLLVTALARRSRRDPAIHLIDQGIYQALWSIGLEADAGAVAAMAGALGDRLPAADVIVVVEASLQTVTRRLRERGGRDSRADGWGREDLQALGRAEALLDEVKGLLTGGGNPPRPAAVIAIDNDDDRDLERNARHLAEAVSRLPGAAA